jgi:hypothetical protein
MREQYQRYPWVVYSLDRDYRIDWCNDAWDRFAAANGAPQLRGHTQIGRRVFDTIPTDLQSFYRKLFKSVILYGRESEHFYECSSPERRRLFHMRILPEPSGLLLVNSLTIESPQRAVRYSVESEYHSSADAIRMCSHCRRTYNTRHQRWDWVSRFVQPLPAGTKYELCDFCRAYHYP